MTNIFFDGFEDGLTSRWDEILPSIQTSSGVGPSGAYHASVSTAVKKIIDVADEHDTMTVGLRFMGTSGTLQPVNFTTDNGTMQQLYISVAVGSQLSVRNSAGGILASGLGPVIAGSVWYYLEVKYRMHDTLGSYEVRLNEVVIYSASGIDTRYGATTKTGIDRVNIINGGGTMRIDDVYINNGAGSVNNSFLGDVVVEGIIPTGDGAYSQFVGSDGNSTANWQLVDDQLLADYVESGTSGNVDTYAMADLSRASGSVFAVMVSALSQKTDAGARGLKPVIRRGSTNYDGAEDTLAQTADVSWDIWELDPSTSAAWTVAGVNAMEAGVKVGT